MTDTPTPQEAAESGLSSHALFGLRPKAGDVWEFKRKGRKVRKEVGSIYLTWFTVGEWPNKTQVKLPYVAWKRMPKGRYSGMRVKRLMKNGTRISTKAERDEAFAKRMAARRDPNAKDVVTPGGGSESECFNGVTTIRLLAKPNYLKSS
jgi:hypothetical protein